MNRVLSRALKWVTAFLGLWLIIEISVFAASPALWIAFGTAIAIALVGVIDFGVAVARRDSISAAGATVTVLLAGFLILASLIFDGASRGWIVATAGGVTEVLALGSLVLAAPRWHGEVASAVGTESREEIRRAA
jgi:hypothetical protein